MWEHRLYMAAYHFGRAVRWLTEQFQFLPDDEPHRAAVPTPPPVEMSLEDELDMYVRRQG